MRYLVGLICVLALGVMGCSESPPPPPPPAPECEADADCDDGNECTWERCHSWDDSCDRVELNQAPCDFDGLAAAPSRPKRKARTPTPAIPQ